MTSRFGFLLALVAGLSLATIAVAQPVDDPSPALLEDAAWYAAEHDVTLNEAVERLRLQLVAGELAGELRQNETSRYGGLWIEHEPEWRVVVRFRGARGAEAVEPYVGGGPLAGLVDVEPAAVALEQLEQRQGVVHHLASQLGYDIDSEVNVFDNRLDVFSVQPEAFENAVGAAGIRLPERTQVHRVPELARLRTLRGGEPGSTCTGGFTVRRSTGELGISTAAHCGNIQYFQGTYLPFRGEDQEGNQDVQWHSACDLLDVSNEFNSGLGYRACTGTQHRNQQAIGSYVCKYGKTTGRTCGYIQSKSYAPSYVTNAASTFVRVDGLNQAGDGDSGSPYFLENLAYGILSGSPGSDLDDALYMPINYISSLGVSVLTYDPGVCNLYPNAEFSYSAFGTRVDFNASASSDPDGSIVSYYWDFDDGYTTTTTSPYVTHYYGSEDVYYVRLTVTDNEGATGLRFMPISLCDGQRICEF